MGDAVEVTFYEFDRCCNGWKRVVKITYTGLVEEETLIENNSIFCESQIFRGQTTLVSGLLKLENFT